MSVTAFARNKSKLIITSFSLQNSISRKQFEIKQGIKFKICKQIKPKYNKTNNVIKQTWTIKFKKNFINLKIAD